MKLGEFNMRFFKAYPTMPDYDVVPILITPSGVFSPQVDYECLEFKSREEAIKYWEDRGYKKHAIKQRTGVINK